MVDGLAPPSPAPNGAAIFEAAVRIYCSTRVDHMPRAQALVHAMTEARVLWRMAHETAADPPVV